jgi:peroxisomal 2,4-dienoyl-CoA reductase
MSIFKENILKDRVALVSGGGSGICKGIALALAQHGAQVAVMGRKPEPLAQTVAEIEALGQKALAVPGDVRRPEEVEAAVQKTVAHFGGIDLLINGAAGNFLCPAAQLSPNGFRTVVEIDLLGTFNMTRACFETLSARRGAVINISATLHYGGTPLQSHVAAAKAGIDALTKNLAVEWGPLGIRTNAIAPGPVEGTEGMSRLAPGEMRDKLIASTPLQRFCRIEEIGWAAVYLASDAAAYINGAIMVVDGGRWLNNMPLEMS